MGKLTTPRYQTAQSGTPGNPLFWETVLNQSDIFAYNTVNDGKGGPFGAQLWLVHAAKDQYVLVGTAQEPEDSNAVVSTGRASAHAEAENLSPEKRAQVIGFLENHRNEGWQIVQVSSGESCPSCRSKQVLFADELIGRGLLRKNDFHVIFKATYGQTKRDAGFNDAPYDQAFRAIGELGVLGTDEGLLGLEAALMSDETAAAQIKSGELVYIAVDLVKSGDLPEGVDSIFQRAGSQPVAVIVRADGSILSHAFDQRVEGDSVNQPEKTALVGALYQAAAKLRDEGKFEAWDLEGARLFTNVRDIGPMAYSESLWCNLSGMAVVEEYSSAVVDSMAQEMPGTRNAELFEQVAADYDHPGSPLKVIFHGDQEEASVAHLLWKAKMAMESLQNRQAERLLALEQGADLHIQYIDGTRASLSRLVCSSRQSSHYDGKQAEPEV